MTFVQKLNLDNKNSLAYCMREGNKNLPTIVFCHGYKSDMFGSKATALDEFCAKNNYSLLRFEYSGHGSSSGKFEDGNISKWTNDALNVINHATNGDLIIIGSSMGAWIGLLIAQKLKSRVKGFIGIASAPDFTHWVWHKQMTEEQRELCEEQGYIDLGHDTIVTFNTFMDGKNNLILNQTINFDFPVTLLHGKMDDQVPWEISEKLKNIITPTNANLILIDDGDHNLSRPDDLEILFEQVNYLIGATSV